MTDWDERDFYQQAIDGIDRWARYDRRSRDGNAKVRTILLGLRSRGLLDGKAVIAAMKKRGHGGQALKLLRDHIERTYREPPSDEDTPGTSP